MFTGRRRRHHKDVGSHKDAETEPGKDKARWSFSRSRMLEFIAEATVGGGSARDAAASGWKWTATGWSRKQLQRRRESFVKVAQMFYLKLFFVFQLIHLFDFLSESRQRRRTKQEKRHDQLIASPASTLDSQWPSKPLKCDWPLNYLASGGRLRQSANKWPVKMSL